MVFEEVELLYDVMAITELSYAVYMTLKHPIMTYFVSLRIIIYLS